MALAIVLAVMVASNLHRYLTCPACNARLSVSAAHPAGTQVQCGACAMVFRAPGPAVMTEVPHDALEGGSGAGNATPALSLRPVLQSDSVRDDDDLPDSPTEEQPS